MVIQHDIGETVIEEEDGHLFIEQRICASRVESVELTRREVARLRDYLSEWLEAGEE